MSQRNKNTSLKIFYILFLTTLGFQELNSASASASTSTRGETEFEVKSTIQSTSQATAFKANVNHSTVQSLNFNHDKSQFKKLDSNSFLTSTNSDILSHQTIYNHIERETLLADISVDRFIGKNPEDPDDTKAETSPVLKLVRQVSLFFFLLFFVPFGLFYPFFLFYKNLFDPFDLNDEAQFTEEAFKSSLKIPSTLVDEEPEIEEYSYLATFYQLQIAFSAEAKAIKQQLKQISSQIDRQNGSKFMELMGQTVSILNNQQYWTHCSYSSVSLPYEAIQAKLDSVLFAEKDKCMKRELTIINNDRQAQKLDRSAVNNVYRYTVVTLVFSTSNSTPLFKQINTKEELAAELRQLNKMSKDNLINFKLLWNPPREGKFVSNEQLLMDYPDMVRLF